MLVSGPHKVTPPALFLGCGHLLALLDVVKWPGGGDLGHLCVAESVHVV